MVSCVWVLDILHLRVMDRRRMALLGNCLLTATLLFHFPLLATFVCRLITYSSLLAISGTRIGNEHGTNLCLTLNTPSPAIFFLFPFSILWFPFLKVFASANDIPRVVWWGGVQGGGEERGGHEQGKVFASFHKWSFLDPAPYTQGSFTLPW